MTNLYIVSKLKKLAYYSLIKGMQDINIKVAAIGNGLKII